jgi:lipopolysaccharide/colanic/teichoic acid biosynthesis glycosyltransferase
VKRAIDVLAAVTGLMVLAPVLAVAALLVWLEDSGPPFYAGPRVARGGGMFRMLKFRTMLPGASHSGVNSTAAGDRRITRVGGWLRRWKLDELPQLINVLRGEMSLVGPRPQVPVEVDMYTEAERRILQARPGITDLASIVFSDEAWILDGAADPDLMYHQRIRPWKSRLALFYVDRIAGGAAGLDLRILALTAVALVRREWALAGVQAVLEGEVGGELLRRMAGRQETLIPYPPPGARDIVREYRARRVGA